MFATTIGIRPSPMTISSVLNPKTLYLPKMVSPTGTLQSRNPFLLNGSKFYEHFDDDDINNDNHDCDQPRLTVGNDHYRADLVPDCLLPQKSLTTETTSKGMKEAVYLPFSPFPCREESLDSGKGGRNDEPLEVKLNASQSYSSSPPTSDHHHHHHPLFSNLSERFKLPNVRRAIPTLRSQTKTKSKCTSATTPPNSKSSLLDSLIFDSSSLSDDVRGRNGYPSYCFGLRPSSEETEESESQSQSQSEKKSESEVLNDRPRDFSNDKTNRKRAWTMNGTEERYLWDQHDDLQTKSPTANNAIERSSQSDEAENKPGMVEKVKLRQRFGFGGRRNAKAWRKLS